MSSFLFFTPYAGRTGSEMFLWYMLSKADPSKIKATLISDSNGELLAQMPKWVNTHLTMRYPNRKQRFQQKVASRFGIDLCEKDILAVHRNAKADYWYLNTVLMLNKLPLAKKHGIKTIVHFHELKGDYALASYQHMELAVNYADLCIADSMAVYKSLQTLGAKKIALQYECVDLGKVKPDPQKTAALKKQFGLDKFSFVWLMSGTSIQRKGIDMVPEIAAGLKAQNAALVWLGNNATNGLSFFIEKEIAARGLDNVFFLGKQSTDYYSYMDMMDGFVLLSREEPFGMVVVEALALGKPVVAFNAGGVAEILTEDTGRIINSWNITDMVNGLNAAAADLSWFNPAAAISRAGDFDVNAQVKNWEKILEEIR